MTRVQVPADKTPIPPGAAIICGCESLIVGAENKLGSPGRAASTLHHGVISPAPTPKQIILVVLLTSQK